LRDRPAGEAQRKGGRGEMSVSNATSASLSLSLFPSLPLSLSPRHDGEPGGLGSPIAGRRTHHSPIPACPAPRGRPARETQPPKGERQEETGAATTPRSLCFQAPVFGTPATGSASTFPPHETLSDVL